ncbi:hypothetical protein ASZ90_010878 [hydrocarbon metagenome]|uniref:Uncharacterized protein n=1 Tax=hydrocarbon metagenome TaxID=938273 RepID=A0A0W8FES4_9ZZZZ
MIDRIRFKGITGPGSKAGESCAVKRNGGAIRRIYRLHAASGGRFFCSYPM